MQVIPVIDIRNGVVVRAVAGKRANYRPLISPLAASPAPLEVVRGLRARFDFTALYIADLDAIEGRGANRKAIETIEAAYPDLRLWLDAGARGLDDIERLLAHPNVDAVVGSESFSDPLELAQLHDEPRAILSLDFLGDDFLGPPALLSAHDGWPRRVIVMTLARIGAGQGPDFARLSEIVGRAGGRLVYAAGGVRGPDDLRRLAARGADGALVASALHDGALPPKTLAPRETQ